MKVIKVRTGWGCGFCSAFHSSQRRHLEHIADEHYAKGKTKAHWTHASVIYGLLHQPKVHERWLSIVRDHASSQALPQGQKTYFSWHDRKTGRAHGFVEGLCKGNLQDKLEFFDPKADDAEALAKLAFDQADKMSYPRTYVSGNLSPQWHLSKPLPAAPTTTPPPGSTFTIRGVAGGSGEREALMMSDSMAEMPHIVSAAMGGESLGLLEDPIPAATPLLLDEDIFEPLAEVGSRQRPMHGQHGGVGISGLDVTIQDFSTRLPATLQEDGSWLDSRGFLMSQ